MVPVYVCAKRRCRGKRSQCLAAVLKNVSYNSSTHSCACTYVDFVTQVAHMQVGVDSCVGRCREGWNNMVRWNADAAPERRNVREQERKCE